MFVVLYSRRLNKDGSRPNFKGEITDYFLEQKES